LCDAVSSRWRHGGQGVDSKWTEARRGCSYLTGCGKTISAQQNFDGLHAWASPVYLVYLVYLVDLVCFVYLVSLV